MKKILIVDDDPELRSNLMEILTEAGYEVSAAASGMEAVEMATAEDFDLVLLDLIMPKMKGNDVLVELRRVSPRARIIMMTAFATVDQAVDAIRRGAADYLAKPFKVDDLLMRMKRVLEEARVESCTVAGDFDRLLSSLSNPIRRTILRLLAQRNAMRLMDLVRELDIADHTKVIFHLKILKEAEMVEQGKDKSYSLGREGLQALECLNMLERHLASR